MSTMTPAQAMLSTYKERFAGSDVLGRIAWYTVREQLWPHRDLKAALEAADLKKYTPRKPSELAIFKRVTKAAQTNSLPQPDGTFANILVREVGNDPTELLKRVVVEIVDADKEQLAYTEAWDLRFLKDTNTIQTNRRSFMPYSVADSVVPGIVRRCAQERGCINEGGIRRLINSVLMEDNLGISVRSSGGVLFMPAGIPCDMLDKLDRLFDGHRDVDVHWIPLPRDARQTGMVKTAVNEAVGSGVDNMMAEARKLLTSDKLISEASVAAVAGSFKRIKEQVELYQALLSDELADATIRMDLLTPMMAGLTTKLATQTASLPAAPSGPSAPGDMDAPSSTPGVVEEL